ncbi:MAG TPA: electron transport complex subunit RsxC [Actinobacteria bacterium]|nr:electron transport complex subunit RsxC [Actinomycetota bacterium]
MIAKTFSRGIHPEDRKERTQDLPIRTGHVPKTIILPLQQHAGRACEALVARGDQVLVGQKIADSDAQIAAPIHSSVSGKVKAIEPRLHCSGIKITSIVIESDGEQSTVDYKKPSVDPSPQEIRALVREAGVVGLGGAAFPTHVKINPPQGTNVDSVIVNGCECEPFLTGDYRLMLEESASIVDGLKLLKTAVGAERGYIGIETNKPDAIEVITGATLGDNDIEVVPLEAKYPQGAEKQLIMAVLNRVVPVRALPSAVGALVQNVETTIAISRAVRAGEPLMTKVLTVSGGGIINTANLRVQIGTPIADVISACGGLRDGVAQIILGGPMMGTALTGLEAPVVKATSGILALTGQEIINRDIQPCIKCGRCVEVCPMGLQPSRLGNLVEFEILDEFEDNDIMDCVECGSCAFICPSRRPLVQYIKLGKYMLAQKGRKRKTASIK